ncbi:aldose 1-epimerase family protein [Apilactobacillus ozensis]|uniref:Aldose epimerase n=1 Tax=Apilactobacillus ozensis DSM 23829 = JCM 17196 TaxID=1423781 RepID=A0A0R2AXD0_9LACO|nr:aldose 1-epimerase family protein [Apilactobacillus ozensis]KRM67891.1 aldose epimerase [Apilactobacillus ozensis DSM 23829 = JCM 17196]MCK8606505.1 aldose 1-epimerase family protein [Apilactobacillus ozensis]
MLVKLENEYLTVLLNTKGAELSSVKNNKTSHEYIWQADANFWGRHAPVLFPIVGRLKDDFYYLDGKKYSMGQHGFARDNDFNIIDQDTNHITFELTENDETLAMYPYEFSLQITYILKAEELKVEYNIRNDDSKEMYYAIGAHPAFNLTESIDNYSIKINNGGKYNHIPLNNSLSDFNDIDELDANVPLRLSREFFKDDAQIIDTNGNDQTSFSLFNEKSDFRVNVNAYNCKYAGIWSTYPKDGSFVCIEPWWGIADNTNHNHEIKNKTGINALMPSKNSEYRLDIQFL